MDTLNLRFTLKQILQTVYNNRCIINCLNQKNGNVSLVYVEKIRYVRDKEIKKILLNCKEEKYSCSYRWMQIDGQIIKQKFQGKRTDKLVIKFVKWNNEWVNSDILFVKPQPQTQLFQVSEIQQRIDKDYTSVGMEDVDNIINFGKVMKDKKYLGKIILPSCILNEIWFFLGAEIIHDVKKEIKQTNN